MKLRKNEEKKAVGQFVYPDGYKVINGTIYKEDHCKNLFVVMSNGYIPHAFIKEIDRQGELKKIIAICLINSEEHIITIRTDAIFGSRKAFIDECRLNDLVLFESSAKDVADFCVALLQNPEKYFPYKHLIAKQSGFVGKELAFAFPNEVIQKSDTDTTVIHPSINNILGCAVEPKGSYDIYREKILAPNAPNIVKFLIIYSLSSMLLDFADVESGGFHLYGPSGAGKTGGARMAGSVYGRATAPDRNISGRSYLKQLNLTDNSVEPLFPLYNNMLLIFDEFGKLVTSDLSAFLYKIGSGAHKIRTNTSLELVESEPSRGFILTTGEISIAQALANANESNQAKGKAVRLPSILIKPEYFETDEQSSHDYVQEVTKVITNNYGHLSRDFIVKLFNYVKTYEDVASMVEDYFSVAFYNYIEKLEPKTSIENRFLQRLAFIHSVAQIAFDLGVLTWNYDDIDEAMMFIYECWKSEDSNTMTDAEVGVKNIINFIKRNAHCFLDAENDDIWGKSDIIGYEKGNDFYILPERFERLCGTAHIDDVLKLLSQKGLLRSDKGKRVKRAELKAVGKRAYYYVLSRDILSEI